MDILYDLWFYSLKLNRRLKSYILIEKSIEPYKLFQMNIDEILGLGFDILTADYIKNNKNMKEIVELNNKLRDENINFISYKDNNYPEILRNIPDAPIGLFYMGNINFPNNLIAVVGTRKASSYGKTMAYKFSYEMSKYSIGIVSGMARGIDTEAHTGTLDAGGFTIAVLGSGFDNIYPRENIKLMNRIIDNGCVITEYLPHVKPYAYNFPERNRIISGLSKGVLVVEASLNSGSIITANNALEQGRDVYAIPGDIYKEGSKGCNKLIKDGAKLIDSIDDLLEEFNISIHHKDYLKLDDIENNIINLISNGYITFEQLKIKTLYETNLLLSKLTVLECKGIIKKMYGGNYILIKT